MGFSETHYIEQISLELIRVILCPLLAEAALWAHSFPVLRQNANGKMDSSKSHYIDQVSLERIVLSFLSYFN